VEKIFLARVDKRILESRNGLPEYNRKHRIQTSRNCTPKLQFSNKVSKRGSLFEKVERTHRHENSENEKLLKPLGELQDSAQRLERRRSLHSSGSSDSRVLFQRHLEVFVGRCWGHEAHVLKIDHCCITRPLRFGLRVRVDEL
jgi:hypothetical protein